MNLAEVEQNFYQCKRTKQMILSQNFVNNDFHVAWKRIRTADLYSVSTKCRMKPMIGAED
jgi:hypothetical protein